MPQKIYSPFTPAEVAIDTGASEGRMTSRRLPSLADGLLATLRANVAAAGDTVSDATLAALRDPLERLMRSSAFSKLKELWVPVGSSATTGALVKILAHPTAGAAMTGIGLVSGDYGAATGITGNGTNKGVDTGLNPTTAGFTANSWGFGVYALSTTASGALGGTRTASNTYINFLGDNSSSINGVSISSAPQYARFGSVQVNGSSCEASYGGHVQAAAAYSSGTLPNANLALLMANNGNWSSQSVCGYAAWTPALTPSEKLELSVFFDSAALVLGRAGFKPALCAAGDSNTRGYLLGNITAERWSALLAARFGLTDSNAGVDDTTMSNRAVGGVGNWVVGRKISNSYRYAGTLNVVSLGTNDDRYRVTPADFAYDYETWLNYQWAAGFDPSQFILCAPIATFDAFSRQEVQQAYRSAIRQLADKYGCGFHDDWALTKDVPGIWQGDATHLNAAGHALKAASLTALIGASLSGSTAFRPAEYR